MLYFEIINISRRINVDKTSASIECDICHYWYFLNFSFEFEPNVCNRSHDLLMISMNLSNISILNIKSSDYCCIISVISKNEAISVMQNAVLTKTQNIIKHKNLLSHIKMGKEILTLRDNKIEKKNIFFYCIKTPVFLRMY